MDAEFETNILWNGYIGVSEQGKICAVSNSVFIGDKWKPPTFFFVMAWACLPIWVSDCSKFHYYFNSHGPTLQALSSAMKTEHFPIVNPASLLMWFTVTKFLVCFIISNATQVAALTFLFSHIATELMSSLCLLTLNSLPFPCSIIAVPDLSCYSSSFYCFLRYYQHRFDLSSSIPI